MDLNQAIFMAKTGNFERALRILAQILKENPKNEEAWIWLSVCVDDDKKRVDCLRKVLEINPRNDQAKKELNHVVSRLQDKSKLEQVPVLKVQAKPGRQPQQEDKNKKQKEKTKRASPVLPHLAKGNVRQILVEKKNRSPKKEKNIAKNSFNDQIPTRQNKKNYYPDPKNDRSGIPFEPPIIYLQRKFQTKRQGFLSENQTKSEIKLHQEKEEVASADSSDLTEETVRQKFMKQKKRTNKIGITAINAGSKKQYRIQKKKKRSEEKQKENGYRKPEILIRENDSLFGFKAGVNPISRLDTGIFGKTTFVDGIRIHLFDEPKCLRTGQDNDASGCDYCDFFSPINCLLKYDEFLIEDLNRFKAIRLKKRVESARWGKAIVQIILYELKAHGRPLHYSIIAKIIISRYPKLRLGEKSVYQFIILHPELFERVDPGVYRAK
jgi:hypothetical protein